MCLIYLTVRLGLYFMVGALVKLFSTLILVILLKKQGTLVREKWLRIPKKVFKEGE